MRDILVDQLRRRQAAKRGGAHVKLTLEDAVCGKRRCRLTSWCSISHDRLGAIKPRYTQIMEMRCLAGLTIDETAEALQLSHATIEREWNFRPHMAPARTSRETRRRSVTGDRAEQVEQLLDQRYTLPPANARLSQNGSPTRRRFGRGPVPARRGTRTRLGHRSTG